MLKVWKHHSHNKPGRFSLSVKGGYFCLNHLFSPVSHVPPPHPNCGQRERGPSFILLITGIGVLLGALRWHQVITLVPRLVPLAPVGLAPTTFHRREEGTLKGETSGTRGPSVEKPDDGRRTALESWNFREWEDVQWWSGGNRPCLFEVDGWK